MRHSWSGRDSRAAGLAVALGVAVSAGVLLPADGAAAGSPASGGRAVARSAARAVPPTAAPAGRPVAYIENAGQWDARAQFGVDLGGSRAFVSGASVVFADAAPTADGGSVIASASFVLAGARDGARFRGDRALAGRANFLLGNEEGAWRRGVATFASLRCEEAWPGVDATLRIEGGSVAYGFEVGPGADPGAVAVAFPRSRGVSFGPDGGLAVETSCGVLRQSPPAAWQEVGGVRRPVSVAFAPAVGGGVRFALGAYDPAHPLTIDPVVDFASYFGGNDEDTVNGVEMMGDNEIVLTGFTESTDLPTTAGVLQTAKAALRDIFITRIAADGQSLVWSTYLGGNGADIAECVARSSDGTMLAVGGRTGSTNYPTAGTSVFQTALSGAFEDGVLTIVDAATGASISYSSYYGGSAGNDAIHDVACTWDADEGNLGFFVAVGTAAGQFANPFTGLHYPAVDDDHQDGTTDAFVIGVSYVLSETRFGTYWGGTGDDTGAGIAGRMTVGGDHTHVWFTGGTTGSLPVGSGYDFTYNGGASDAYLQVLTISNGGTASMGDGTYLGGSDIDSGSDVVLDGGGRPIVTGGTRSSNFPQVSSLYAFRGGDDIFVARFGSSTDVDVLEYSTLLGGSGSESGNSIGIDGGGAVYVTGRTTTSPSDFNVLPITGDGSDGTLGGAADAFLLKLHPITNSIRYLTYLGGDADETGVGVAVNFVGLCAVGGFTNSTTTFPTVEPYDGTYGGGSRDGFFARVSTATIVLDLGSCRLDEFRGKPAGPGPNKDQIIIAGKYTGSLTFTPASMPFHVAVGPVDQIHVANIPAAHAGWKSSGAKHTWKGTLAGRAWQVQIDTTKKTFNVKVTKTNLNAGNGLQDLDQVAVILGPGSAEGADVTQWVEPATYSTRATRVLVNP